MALSNFDKCFPLLMGNEGGYTVDNGGPTMWGITQAVARRYGYTGDMQALPLSTAQSIARKEYWPDYLDQVPVAVAFQVFDTLYNGGAATSWLQEALGLAVDGVAGPLTIAAAQQQNVWKTVALFNAKRLEYFAAIRQPQYSGGRFNRIAGNLQKGGLV